jgi:GTP-binding protein YchF
MMRLGIIGLPNVGKSTLLNALTKADAEVGAYPFTTIDRNIGIVEVRDERLDRLGELLKPEKLTPARVEVVDIAGLVRGASKGEGLGNRFLGHIREVDCVLHVVRLFRDENVAHVEQGIDPRRDVEIINLELALADLDTVAKQIEKTRKAGKTGDAGAEKRLEALGRIEAALNDGTASAAAREDDEIAGVARELFLLTTKPTLYVANCGEEDLSAGQREGVRILEELAASEGRGVVVVSAKSESELAELSLEECGRFRAELGLEEFDAATVVERGYCLLDLITFYTIVGTETRAWSLIRGTPMVEAAGRIHTDMAKGFIKAEVVSCDRLFELSSWEAAREHGELRIEGRDYVVQDGDVVHVRFHV